MAIRHFVLALPTPLISPNPPALKCYQLSWWQDFNTAPSVPRCWRRPFRWTKLQHSWRDRPPPSSAMRPGQGCNPARLSLTAGAGARRREIILGAAALEAGGPCCRRGLALFGRAVPPLLRGRRIAVPRAAAAIPRAHASYDQPATAKLRHAAARHGRRAHGPRRTAGSTQGCWRVLPLGAARRRRRAAHRAECWGPR